MNYGKLLKLENFCLLMKIWKFNFDVGYLGRYCIFSYWVLEKGTYVVCQDSLAVSRHSVVKFNNLISFVNWLICYLKGKT